MIENSLLIISWFYILFGMISVFKFKNLYSRLLSSSTIDTVASLTILFALMFVTKEYKYIIRIVLIIVFILITNPISNHLIIRSAYLNGVAIKKEGEHDSNSS